jgi:Secretion system C-terminal sorting domain
MKLFAKLFSASIFFIGTNLIAQPTCNWAFIPTSTSLSHNNITATATDSNGNIIEVGKVTGRADMNPGSGPTDTSFTRFFYNHYLSKTSANGNLLWVYYFEDNSQIASMDFKGLIVNAAGEIIVAGNFTGKVDFDLLHSEDTIRSHSFSAPDYFLAKYDASGNHLWALTAGNSTNGISAQAISLLPNNTILLVANPSAVTDVDPSNAVNNTVNFSAHVIAYSSSGTYLWLAAVPALYTYGVSNQSLDCDGAGNSYLLSVGSYELTVSKFSLSGTYLWSKKIGNFSAGARVNPQSVLVDKSNGAFYLAGTFDGGVDFNPGNSNLLINSSGGMNPDGFIAKYDSSMSPIWVNPYAAKVSFGNYSLAFDNSDLVAVGNFVDSINFGNGWNFSSTFTYSPFYVKLSPAGIAIDGFILNGQGQFYTINSCSSNSKVITGNITAWVDMDPSNLQRNLQASTTNFFTAVYQFPTSTSITKQVAVNEKNILAYPNPFENELILKVTQASDMIIQITDLAGRTIFQCKNSSTQILVNTQEWPRGIYFLRMNEQNFKLIKN